MRNWRVNLFFLFIILFWAAIIGRLFYLQVLNGDFYSALAKGQQTFPESKGTRGEIFLQDKNGKLYPLAVNKDWPQVFISPNEIEDKEKTGQILSEVLNLDRGLIVQNLGKDSLYVPIKNKLTEEEISGLKTINLPGVYLKKEKGREYPQEEFASHLVGFLGGDGKGYYGLEGYWDSTIQGEAGFLKEKKGADLILTIDYNIQYQAEKSLKEAQKKLNINGGTIIVAEPETGKILALANFPNFDPNRYQEQDLELFKNSAIQKIYEPGSVFKPITMAAALEEGKISPQTTYQDPGIIEIGGWPIYNYDRRVYPGETSMTEVLEKSINTGAVFVEKQLGHGLFLDYIQRFGIFEKTGIDLQGEDISPNTELKKGQEVSFTTASFGQGIGMTPIQLLRAFCVIANGGKLVKPYIVEKIKMSDNEVREIEPEIINNTVISLNTASKLTAMLISVVENGFAKKAQIPGYYVAGKTGTALVPFTSLDINKRGYSEQTWQTFIGFVPAFSPRFLILVKLDNPATKTAEYSTVPIFRDLAKYIIDYKQLPPDYK